MNTVLQICSPECIDFASVQDLTNEEMQERHCPVCDCPACYLTFEVACMMFLSILAEKDASFLSKHETIARLGVAKRHEILERRAASN